MKKLRLIFIFLFACCVMPEAYAQKVAVKSNLLYAATATFNLGVEFGLARKWTLDVPVNLNPWKFNDGMRLRHWGVQPEVRNRIPSLNFHGNSMMECGYGIGVYSLKSVTGFVNDSDVRLSVYMLITLILTLVIFLTGLS